MKNTKEELLIQINNIKSYLIIFTNKDYLEIIDVLNINGTLTVNEIVYEIKIQQPVVSTKLSFLKKLKIVKSEKVGRKRYYSVNIERYQKVISLIKKFANELDTIN